MAVGLLIVGSSVRFIYILYIYNPSWTSVAGGEFHPQSETACLSYHVHACGPLCPLHSHYGILFHVSERGGRVFSSDCGACPQPAVSLSRALSHTRIYLPKHTSHILRTRTLRFSPASHNSIRPFLVNDLPTCRSRVVIFFNGTPVSIPRRRVFQYLKYL